MKRHFTHLSLFFVNIHFLILSMLVNKHSNKKILFSASAEKNIFPPQGKSNDSSNDFLPYLPQLGFEFILVSE